MPSQKGQGGELNKMKKPGNDTKGAGETSTSEKEKQQGKTTPGRQGTQSSKSSGACGTTADETPSKRSSKDDDPTKRGIHQRGRWRGKPPREGTKVKQATSSENGKVNPDRGTTMEPRKEGTEKTVGRTQSADTQGANGPFESRPNSEDNDSTKQNTGRRDRRKGKAQEGTKGKLQGTSNEKANKNPNLETILDPNKGATQKTVRRRSRSSDSQVAAESSANKPNSTGENSNKQKKGDPNERHKGASKDGDGGKQLTSSTAKGKPSGKKQDHPPGNPANRNATTETKSSTGRPHKSDQKKSSPRKGYTLDLKTLKEKDCPEVVHTLQNNMARLKFFLRSEEKEHNSDDFIFDLTCTLAIACDAPATESTNKILAALKGSAFFSSKLPCLLDRVQKAKTEIGNPEAQRRLVEWLLKIFIKYLMHLPSSYADPPYDLLKETLEQSKTDGKDELRKQLDDFKQRRDQIIKAEREKHGRRYTNKAGQKPPDDFREMPICPTNKEITSQERPFLRKNIKKGRYDDAEHYLDVQFRLLREDFLEPLREGIYEITHNIPKGQRNQLMKCYQGVRIVGKEFTLSGINHKVRFDVSKFGMTNWANSKRLIFGSFLCLSKDNFETMLFATVANRDPKDLGKGRFEIRFIEEQNIFDIEKSHQEYQMVESPAYFEAYRHVLQGLKGLNEESLPFTEYLVECSAEVAPPEYLIREDDQDPVYYNLSKGLGVPNLKKAMNVPVLDTEAWPSVDALHLNPSQLEALRTAVTTEFSVIQGPPGTGKTYIGAKIVRCLLENRKQWDPDKIAPMLMVCYTNHALDQFLEKVLEFLPKREIIRVGGRCKSEKLEECNLKLFTKRYRRQSDRIRLQWKIKDNEEEINACKAVLAKADKKFLELRLLEGYMKIQHTDQLYEAAFPPNAVAQCRKTPNTFKLWLGNNKQLNHLNQSKKVSESNENDESEDGSIFLQDGASEDVDDSNDALVAVALSSTSSHLKEDVEGSNEHSNKERLKENTTNTISPRDTETMFTLERDQSQLPKSKDDDLLVLNGSAIVENGSSSNHALQDELHCSVSFETRNVPITAVTEHRAEQSQQSDTFTDSDLEADQLTITVEGEATRIQNERRIEGDKEDTLGISQQSLEEASHQESDGEIIEGNNEGTEAIYKKNSFPFAWYKATKRVHSVGTENSERNTAAETSSNHALQDELHLSVSFEVRNVPITASTEHRTEQSQQSDTFTDSDLEADELTITVEDEATRIQNERRIEGDEEDTLAISQQSIEEESHQESDGEIIEENKEETEAIYKKNSFPFVWYKATKGDGKGVDSVDTENSQRNTAVETRAPKSHDKIDLTVDINYLQTRLQKSTAMSSDEAEKVTNIWELSEKDRFRLCLYWVECYRERERIEIQRGEEKHGQLCAELEGVKSEEEEEVIRRATVVGMTTSCAARYHSMLQRIAPKIVIIEEAAEVMEAHIITSLSRNTKHTILIGDHKQLRPKATVYELAQKYNLEISLFERMVLNSMECKRLSTQHRMRPEIAALTKRIYEHEIVDHESVCAFDDISGLMHNMFFIDHCQPEALVGGMQSFSNPHEAGFLVALCRYLLLQGYKREQITVLTMYTGQLLELKNRMPRSEFEGIKVCVVDNYQGEENDIILLSLVRSKKIGFLKESNRICVALSRARQGFYCIGNFTLLKSQCMLWKEICNDLETKNLIGQTLKLVCKRHSNVNEVRSASDIQKFPYGGCDKVCGERLNCGHACDRACHATDEFHEYGQCRKVCWKSCPNEHQCQRRCHHPFDCLCGRPMVKIIPKCGHEQTVQCCTEPEDFICQVKCEKTLDCGHRCTKVCGSPCIRQCKVHCSKTLPCGHKRTMLCFKDPIIYSQCNSDCNKVLDCGHPCSKKCKEPCQCNTTIEVELSCEHRVRILCPKKNQPHRCFEKCSRQLHCGHSCPGLCHEECGTYRCDILVEKILPCEHKQIISCHIDPRDKICQEACQNKCDHSHPCQRRCHFGIPCEDCRVMVNKTIPSCKHSIVTPCFVDPAALVCKKPCERMRTCGHPCRDVCGKDCEARPCMKLVPTKLPCEHTVILACNKNLGTYKCKTKVVVDLTCGHKKTIDCYAKNVGIEDVLCNERVEKELSCKHKAVLQCHTNPEDYKCKKKVNFEMTCGHTKSAICSTATTGIQQLSCMVMMTRKLPCEHEVTIPCCEKSEEYSCQEMVDVTLPCGHRKRVECSNANRALEDENREAKCDVMVTKTLPCSHEKYVQCFVKPEEVFCDAPCERLLSCEHVCRGQCSDDCSIVKCAVTVEKDLACGRHKISCLCSEDISRSICLNECKRKLSCGHICVRRCSEKCSDFQCEEMVMKKLNCKENHYLRMACFKDPATELCSKSCKRKLDCGHPCKEVCGQPCETVKCMRRIQMAFTCGHKKWLSCFQRKGAICRAPCLRPKGLCGHLCEGWCGAPCTKYPCKVPVIKTLRCGHNIQMRCCHNPEYVRCPAVCGATLQCGHKCSGTCSDCRQRDSHEICQNPCGRLLVCLHRCRATCCEPCPPCVSRCGRRCPHEKCKQPCSKPCKPCIEPCTWSCPHYQCNNLCGEECDRPRCDAPCPKVLPCGHRCIGLCGETCPTLCAVCHAKRFPFMLADRRGNEKEPVRCLQLFDCGHIIKVQEMDAWMMSQHSSDVQLMRCPRCSTSITFSFRYGNIIKRALKNIENVKAQVQELAVEVSNSLYQLRHLKYDVNKLKFPQSVLRVVQPFARNVRQMHERNILFLFTFKNHMMILQRVQETEQVLESLHTVQVVSNPQSEVDTLSNITTNALEYIKEYLKQPQLDLKILSQVHEDARKFFLFSRALEVQTEVAKQKIALTKSGKTRLKLARDRFAAFLQGNAEALDLQWLREIVDLLRREVHLPPLPAEEKTEFANFPGYQRGVWKSCDQGHVYLTGCIMRGRQDIPVGSEGCTMCTADGFRWVN